MNIDHLVVNVEEKYQNCKETIEDIRAAGFPYEPTWGKGTRGFKASNLWIGDAYFEMIRILKRDGGGWKTDWTNLYQQGHRGLVCLMLDVEDIQQLSHRINGLGYAITSPAWLEFKWCFRLLTRKMPWQNSYLPFFEGAPFQLGFQQMKDQESRAFMSSYMVPNARDNGIQGICSIHINAPFTSNDVNMIKAVFTSHTQINDTIIATLNQQRLIFTKAKDFTVEVETKANREINLQIEQIKLCGAKPR